jgi:hypothetical protein
VAGPLGWPPGRGIATGWKHDTLVPRRSSAVTWRLWYRFSHNAARGAAGRRPPHVARDASNRWLLGHTTSMRGLLIGRRSSPRPSRASRLVLRIRQLDRDVVRHEIGVSDAPNCTMVALEPTASIQRCRSYSLLHRVSTPVLRSGRRIVARRGRRPGIPISRSGNECDRPNSQHAAERARLTREVGTAVGRVKPRLLLPTTGDRHLMMTRSLG